MGSEPELHALPGAFDEDRDEAGEFRPGYAKLFAALIRPGRSCWKSPAACLLNTAITPQLYAISARKQAATLPR